MRNVASEAVVSVPIIIVDQKKKAKSTMLMHCDVWSEAGVDLTDDGKIESLSFCFGRRCDFYH